MGKRTFTNLAIAGLITVAAAVAIMWATAVVREYQTPPELRGNHGPWRHADELGALYEFAFTVTLLFVLPAAWLGTLVERSRRAQVVAVLACGLLFLCCAHFPLFD